MEKKMINKLKDILTDQNKSIQDDKMKRKRNIFQVLFDIVCTFCLIIWIIDDWIIILPDIITIIVIVILLIILIPKIIFSQYVKNKFKDVAKQNARWFVILFTFGIVIDICILGVISIYENFIGLIIFVFSNLIYYLIIRKLLIVPKGR